MNPQEEKIWKKINYIFDTKQKLEIVLLFGAIIFGAFMELVGISAVLPFINVVLNSDKVLENPYLRALYKGLGFRSINGFIILLALLIIAVYIGKNIFIFYMHSMQYKFTYNNQRKLSYKMMNCYIKQPYLYHLYHNSAELSRNINEETTYIYGLKGSILMSILSKLSLKFNIFSIVI